MSNFLIYFFSLYSRAKVCAALDAASNEVAYVVEDACSDDGSSDSWKGDSEEISNEFVLCQEKELEFGNMVVYRRKECDLGIVSTRGKSYVKRGELHA